MAVSNLDQAHSADCTFKSNGSVYTCELSGIITADYEDLKEVNGAPEGTKTNLDVSLLTASPGTVVQSFPGPIIDIFSNLKTIALRSVNMITLTYAIKNCAQLTVIDLGQNKVKTLNGAVFEKCMQLDTIKFDQNEISYILDNAFTGLRSLQTLDLSKNLIKELQHTIGASPFLPLQGLTNLILDYNPLEKLEPTVFSPLLKLQRFSANSNNLTHINGSSFDKNKDLVSISLGSSNISTIDQAAFTNLGNLENLILTDNHLESLPALDGNVKLKVLIAAKNNIAGILLNNDLENLQELHLDSNLLEKIETDAFSYLVGLKNLSLADNKISDLEVQAFSKLSSMEELNLADNELTELKANAFADCTALKKIILRNNAIEKIEREFYTNKPQLKTLDLIGGVCASGVFDITQELFEDPLYKECNFATTAKISILALAVVIVAGLSNLF